MLNQEVFYSEIGKILINLRTNSIWISIIGIVLLVFLMLKKCSNMEYKILLKMLICLVMIFSPVILYWLYVINPLHIFGVYAI